MLPLAFSMPPSRHLLVSSDDPLKSSLKTCFQLPDPPRGPLGAGVGFGAGCGSKRSARACNATFTSPPFAIVRRLDPTALSWAFVSDIGDHLSCWSRLTGGATTRTKVTKGGRHPARSPSRARGGCLGSVQEAQAQAAAAAEHHLVTAIGPDGRKSAPIPSRSSGAAGTAVPRGGPACARGLVA